MPLKAAYVTLLTKDVYLPVTPELSAESRTVLMNRGIATREIQSLQPPDSHALAAHDARFADTWTKLRGFELTEYDRIVLMDSDMIVLRNMDELIDLELPADWIAAAHACACNPRKLAHYPADWIPENCAYTPLVHPTAITSPTQITSTTPRPYNLLNSGLVVLNPSLELSAVVQNYLNSSPLVPTFSFPDQDLLAAFFHGKWKPLPWIYNALKTLRVIHKPLWRDEEIRCLHYILHDKPWQARVGEKGTGGEYEDVNRWWWEQLEGVVSDLEKSDPDGSKLVLANVAPPL
ncbi:hypothetical protein EWM64_g240 [Hericium alpestre]|uniref:Glycosyltransferase family 8 protein n=1 Tax=Hericium alpestre TaxID=135208 RepID=A0A4Z0AB27_9AGAM|nr:hypothetical protein EWM64_g240 [Hericium alpestre]